jgi:hypothetical protein
VPSAPSARLRNAGIEPSDRTLPQMLPHVVKVQEARGIGHKADMLEIGLVSNQIPRDFVESLGYAPKDRLLT